MPILKGPFELSFVVDIVYQSIEQFYKKKNIRNGLSIYNSYIDKHLILNNTQKARDIIKQLARGYELTRRDIEYFEEEPSAQPFGSLLEVYGKNWGLFPEMKREMMVGILNETYITERASNIVVKDPMQTYRIIAGVAPRHTNFFTEIFEDNRGKNVDGKYVKLLDFVNEYKQFLKETIDINQENIRKKMLYRDRGLDLLF